MSEESERYQLPLMHEICPGLEDAQGHHNLLDIGDGVLLPRPKPDLRQNYANPNCYLTPSLRQFDNKAYKTPKMHCINARQCDANVDASRPPACLMSSPLPSFFQGGGNLSLLVLLFQFLGLKTDESLSLNNVLVDADSLLHRQSTWNVSWLQDTLVSG